MLSAWIWMALQGIVLGGSHCVWTDDEGYSFDFSQMDRFSKRYVFDPPAEGMGMFNMVYIFNFCDFKDLNCNGKQVAAFEALEVMGQITENCDIVGLEEQKKIEHVNQNDPALGVQVTVNDGDDCLELQDDDTVSSSKPRVGVFQIMCPADGVDQKEFQIVQGQGCTTILQIFHHFGCQGGQGYFTFVNLLKLLITLFVGYLGVGYTINSKSKGLTGYEAIPHINLWCQLKIMLLSLANWLIRFTVSGYSKLRNREGYDVV